MMNIVVLVYVVIGIGIAVGVLRYGKRAQQRVDGLEMLVVTAQVIGLICCWPFMLAYAWYLTWKEKGTLH